MLFDAKKLLVIAGPCSLENERVCRTVAESLVAIAREQPELKFVFKGSFDKANRTSLAGPRGPGLAGGRDRRRWVHDADGFPVLPGTGAPGHPPAAAGGAVVPPPPELLCGPAGLVRPAAGPGHSTDRATPPPTRQCS